MAQHRPRRGQRYQRNSDGAIFGVGKDNIRLMRACKLRYVSGGAEPKGTRTVAWRRLASDYTLLP